MSNVKQPIGVIDTCDYDDVLHPPSGARWNAHDLLVSAQLAAHLPIRAYVKNAKIFQCPRWQAMPSVTLQLVPWPGGDAVEGGWSHRSSWSCDDQFGFPDGITRRASTSPFGANFARRRAWPPRVFSGGNAPYGQYSDGVNIARGRPRRVIKPGSCGTAVTTSLTSSGEVR